MTFMILNCLPGADDGSEEAAEPSPMNVDGEAAAGLVNPIVEAPLPRGT